MQNDQSRTVGTEDHDERGRVPASPGSALAGPSARADREQPIFGLDFQLDSGHRAGDESGMLSTGGVRVYEIHYVPPGGAAMPLARICVTGDQACEVIDRARGTWLHLEARTEYWHSKPETLAAMAAGEPGGALVFEIAHGGRGSGTSLPELAWDAGSAVVAQVAPRDAVWQPSEETGVGAPVGTYAFFLSRDTPASVRERHGCLAGLCFTVVEEAGAGGETAYRIGATEWYQRSSADLLFAGWQDGEGVVLERAAPGPEGAMLVARCALEPASS